MLSASLVADINPTGSSNPNGFVNLNGKTFFAADDGVNGIGLWSTDGTAAGTVLIAADPATVPETLGLNPTDLTVFGNKVYFSGFSPNVGKILWSTDGTPTGTTVVSAALGYNPIDLTVVGNSLYYESSTGIVNLNSSGGATVVVPASGLAIGNGGTQSPNITAVGSHVFFEAQFYDDGVFQVGGNNTTLYSTDGTTAGTSVIATFETYDLSSQMIGYDGYLYFSGGTPHSPNTDLWRSDGTTAGTVFFDQIGVVLDRGTSDGGFISAKNFVVAGGTLYVDGFTDYLTESGFNPQYNLWESNGTVAGTMLVPGQPAISSVTPGSVAAFGSRVVFTLSDSAGIAPWISDGTATGTFPLDVPSSDQSPADFTVDGTVVYFSNNTTATGDELWSTDGTVAGTSLVADINSGTGSSNPADISVGSTGNLYFSATEPVHGNELWSYTPSATVIPGIISGTITVGGSGESDVTVYLDANNNATLDPGELNTTTGTNGNYSFSSVPVGFYTIRHNVPAGYQQSSPAGNAPINISIASGTVLTNQNYVDAPILGKISGTVTSSGSPVAQSTIFLDANNNSILDAGELSTLTDVNGNYSFNNVPVGSYTIDQIPALGYVQTTPAANAGFPITIVLTSVLTNENFVDAPVAHGSISGVVSTGSSQLAGATISLFNQSGGAVLATSVTNSSGGYIFADVPSGSYTITQTVVPTGYTQTVPISQGSLSAAVSVGSNLTSENFTDALYCAAAGAIQINGVPTRGVVVDISSAQGLSLSTTTGYGGEYVFQNLPPGTYTITQVLPAGDAQISPANNAGITFTVANGAFYNPANFTDVVTQITGNVSTAGGPVVGATVYLDANNNSVLDSGEITATTDNSGNYVFGNVSAGSYVIRQAIAGTYTQTTPTGNAGFPVVIASGSPVVTDNFIDAPILGTISGSITASGAAVSGATVFLDANHNSTLDPGELSTTTISNGSYAFTNVPLGTYTITQILPANYTQTTPTSNAGIAVSIQAGSTLTNENFVDAPVPGTISGSVATAITGATIFLDANNNGVLDAGELSTTTNSGAYSFTGVPLGSYTITQILPSGYTQASPAGNAGISVTVAPGSTFTSENFVDAPIPGTISGSVATSSAPISGVTVYLDANGNSVLDAGELSTTTLSDGTYSFSNVPLGSYVIRQNLPAGDTQTTPAGNAGISVTVNPGSVFSNESFVDAASTTLPPQLTGTTIGTAGSYQNDGNTIAKATDGNLSTFFDGPSANGNWVGLDFGANGAIVTAVKYASRSGWASRMNGGIFQASNSATFASGVVNLYTIAANASPSSTSLTIQTFSNAATYRYYRYLSPANSWGDVSEVQFFGTPGAVVVTGPAQLTGTTIGTAGSYQNDGNTIAKATDGNLATFFDAPSANGNWVGLDLGPTGGVVTEIKYASRINWAARMNGGIFQASNSATFASGVVNLYTIASNANPSSTSLTTQNLTNTTAYRYYRYLSPSGSYGDVSEVQFFGTAGGLTTLTQFTGTTIGTAGSYQNDGNTIAKATDGNLTTFFDGPTASGDWVGLDLGTAEIIQQISYAPRSSWAARMVGGIFQASNTADFSSGVVNLYTITTTPTQGVLTSVAINVSTAYRYVRYLSPANSWGDISEFQVFG